ncbi:unannotated protein [freshwater metagenome]|uniref:Unannotated protein n=1 Tax=freshwater metagenome TaxID=449393 RepID=A0A6J6LUC0_9ZZZZ|nr:hypothetical protein [Actinomycetota bacterium]
MVIAHATSVVQQRAFAQESADSIALAAAFGGTPAAQQLASLLGVSITEIDIDAGNVMVKVSTNDLIATSEATSGR